MKNLFILLFISFQCFSQDKLVVYNFKILEDENLTNNESLGKLFEKGMEEAKHLKLNLEFNDTLARFKIQEAMSIEESNTNMAIAICNCKEEKYIYDDKVYRSNSVGLFKKNEYIIIDSLNTNWTLRG